MKLIYISAARLFFAPFGTHMASKNRFVPLSFVNAQDILNRVFKRKYGINLSHILKISNRICRRRAGYSLDGISTTESVANTNIPILFIHGSEDNFVPVSMSRANYDACAAYKKELCIIPDAGHAESYYRHPELYEKTVFGFIEE